MKNLFYLMTLTLISTSVFAGQLKIACGDNAYDAIESDEASLADVYLELKTRGPNTPVEIKEFIHNGTDLSEAIRDIDSEMYDKELSIKIGLFSYDSYQFTAIRNCEDLDSADGELLYREHVGGFAGHKSHRLKCSCLKY